ncbi:PREDICTED: zinc finger MYM-type protein 1-like [Erythranthe guttata]|uniref:zinc finger MYM-type protein 1-like n=1 Tax=Erythranthe guttata TaxID=4155 RepID=UPI00064E0637|nr:PREDICTED: zinc finger MYM-type protein 1-like [Erythranthe guttata]|eukprot:XP_012839668.1 PREDICTED: zinc finger MYM-type protein 1-like [Erythranthe guttata]
MRLNTSIEVARYPSTQGLAFRGHDESESSANPGNFIALNHKMICSDIQKEIVNVFAMEVLRAIISDIGDSTFFLMVEEARDISMKEQMALVVSAMTLKATIDDFLPRYGLSISKLRGQGYDGASNMKGQFNGLKTLILNENPCAYYIHCFAHQLQLALVAVARKHNHISSLFDFSTRVLNVVGSLCKRRDLLREKQSENIIEAPDMGIFQVGEV